MILYLQVLFGVVIGMALVGLLFVSTRLVHSGVSTEGKWWLKQVYHRPDDRSTDQWERHIFWTMRVPRVAGGILILILTTSTMVYLLLLTVHP